MNKIKTVHFLENKNKVCNFNFFSFIVKEKRKGFGRGKNKNNEPQYKLKTNRF